MQKYIRANATVKQVLVALAALLAGCTVGPNYKAPKLDDVPTSYATTQPTADTTAICHWWETFHDPKLNNLITRAVASNLDLKLAEERVVESRAQLDLTSGNLFPTGDLTGGYTKTQISKEAGIAGFLGNSGGGASSATVGGASGGTGAGAGSAVSGNLARPGAAKSSSSSTGFAIPGHLEVYQAGFDASWEIDVFGGIRRTIEASDADLAATEEARRDALVTLLGDVARNYIEVRGKQRQLKVANDNVRSQNDTLELTQSRYKAGLATDLDVARAQAQVNSTESAIPTLETSLKQSIHRLGVLLGEPPEALLEELSKEGPIPPPVTNAVPVGLPSELLRRRPDVRRAERQFAAATARIGVATADLFPRFSLTGTLGLESQKFKDLARGDSFFWNIGPSVSWPILDAGKITSNIRVQKARQEEALLQYKNTVLTSLEDVENALTGYEQEQIREQSLSHAVDANQRAVQLATLLYKKGLADFLNVLDAQRDLFASQDQLIQSQQNVSADLVALYKALGGGWEIGEKQ
jgi:multidrug efflux system outer membrane protein